MGMHIRIGAGTAVRSAMNVLVFSFNSGLCFVFLNYYYLQGYGIYHFVITDTVWPFQRFSSASLVLVAGSDWCKVKFGFWKNPPWCNYWALTNFPMADSNVWGTFPPSDMFIFLVVSSQLLWVLVNCSVISRLGHPDHTPSMWSH